MDLSPVYARLRAVRLPSSLPALPSWVPRPRPPAWWRRHGPTCRRYLFPLLRVAWPAGLAAFFLRQSLPEYGLGQGRHADGGLDTLDMVTLDALTRPFIVLGWVFVAVMLLISLLRAVRPLWRGEPVARPTVLIRCAWVSAAVFVLGCAWNVFHLPAARDLAGLRAAGRYQVSVGALFARVRGHLPPGGGALAPGYDVEFTVDRESGILLAAELFHAQVTSPGRHP